MIAKKRNTDPLPRFDESILAEIWEAIWKNNEIRCLDIDSISISVIRGDVRLFGHINKENNLHLIEEIVRSIPGVAFVENGLVLDNDLTTQVTSALSKDEHTSPFIFFVNCKHGWVSLDGEVPTYELQAIAEKVAAQVPFTRGIVSLPKVTGKGPVVIRRAVQPRINAQVYGENRQVGRVFQVFIQPCNRLVTHLVACDLEKNMHLIPIEAFQVVNKESVFLQETASLNAFPILGPLDYCMAPSDWRPPYPYKIAEILWPADECPKSL